MKLAGYLYNTKEGRVGERGLCYDYVICSNGVFITAQNKLLTATIRISEADIRGLVPLGEEVKLLWGKIPGKLYYLAIDVFKGTPEMEHYIAITHTDQYHIAYPHQEGTEASVNYECLENKVMDIHSHAQMKPFFSGIDNEDEQGLALYMVVGEMDRLIPTNLVRVGAYGYFKNLTFEDVFDV